MTDRRSPGSTYALDTSVLPRATPEDRAPQPAAGFVESVVAGFRAARQDIPGYHIEETTDAWAPVVDALIERNGRKWTYYTSPQTGQTNVDGVLDDIEAIRRADPTAFPALPSTREAISKMVSDGVERRRAAIADTVSRSDTLPWLIGSLGAGFTDPINVGAMLITGGGSAVAPTLGRQIVREAAINAAVEAVEQPGVAAERAQRGERLTLGEAAANVALAGGLGAVIPPLAAGAKRALTPTAQLAARMRETIGWDRMTDRERAAVDVLERDAGIEASSPFAPGAGTEAHLDRVDRAVEALRGPRPEGALPAVLEPLPGARDALKARIRRVESGGGDDFNEASGAMGPYQFLRSTWLSYYKRRFGDQGLSDDAIAAKRRDPQLNDVLVNDLIADNSAALARIGAPETAGNLYLMHFAGQGGAAKILRAAPDTPIERLMSKAAIEANPFLRGKSAGDVIEWAHAKMGEEPHAGPVLRREEFDGDDAFAAAQREVDAAEAQLAAARLADTDVPSPELQRVDLGEAPAIDPAAPTRGADWDPAAEPVRAPIRLDADTAPEPPLQATMAALDDASPLGPRSVHAEQQSIEGQPGITVLDNDGHIATAVYRDADGNAIGVARIPISDEAADIYEPASVYVVPEQRRQGIATRLYEALERDGYPIRQRSGTGDMTPSGAALANAFRARPPARPNVGELVARALGADRVDPEVAAQLRAEGEALAAPREAADPAPVVEGFDSPDAEAAARQVDSLEHDIRMMIAGSDGEAMTVRLSEDGPAVSVREALEDSDSDMAAIDAARACMKPGGAE